MDTMTQPEVVDENISKEKITGFELKEKPVYDFFKRVFDILASFFATIILIIPMVIISLVIVLKDKGNPFYFHKRIGKNGNSLRVCKFRSMKIGADNLEKMLTPEQLAEYRKEYKLKDDPRLIGYKKPGDGKNCFGSKIRCWSLDELPQITYNILIKGDMTIVGPRPIIEDELSDHYSEEERKVLLSVKPGLTGYWQAYARNNVGYENGKRQKMELYYVKNRSTWLDIKILFKTVGTVLFGKGAN